jgi:hypothetical protein
MSIKTIGIYTSGGGDSINTNDDLIIEIGSGHVACVVSSRIQNAAAAIELFVGTEEETTDFPLFLSNVIKSSKVLHRTFSNTKIFINNECALVVPVSKFSKAIAADYLNMIFGEERNSRIQFEHLEVSGDMMNVFRISSSWFDIINRELLISNFHHTYSNILRRVFSTSLEASFPFIITQFYPAYIITVVIKDGQLQFIQSFIYHSDNDVLYYLLSISKQHNISAADLLIRVSGMIDLQSSLYSQLQKYFRHVEVENIDRSKLQMDVGQHPPHYITPFVNYLV